MLRWRAIDMTRLDSLAPGSRFRLPCTGLCGRLLSADLDTVVQVERPRGEKTFTDRWGESHTIKAGVDRSAPTVWSSGTMVEVLDAAPAVAPIRRSVSPSGSQFSLFGEVTA